MVIYGLRARRPYDYDVVQHGPLRRAALVNVKIKVSFNYT